MIDHFKISSKIYKRILQICICFLFVVLIFVLLRNTHIIVKIGKEYKWGFSKKLSIYCNHNINNENINEIIYMKNLKNLTLSDTRITNVNFLTELDNLEYLKLSNYAEYSIKIPDLKNNKNLEFVELTNVEIQDLNAFSETINLKWLFISPANTKIYDIDGIKKLQQLENLFLYDLECNSYSVLFELKSLQHLSIDDNLLNSEEIQILNNNGIDIYIRK